MNARMLIGMALTACLAIAQPPGIGGGEAVQPRLALELRAPDSAWTLTAERAVAADGRIVAMWSLHRPPDLAGAAMITTVRASMPVDPGEREVLHVVTGKTWRWTNERADVRFVDSFCKAEELLRGGRVLWRAERSATHAVNRARE